MTIPLITSSVPCVCVCVKNASLTFEAITILWYGNWPVVTGLTNFGHPSCSPISSCSWPECAGLLIIPLPKSVGKVLRNRTVLAFHIQVSTFQHHHHHHHHPHHQQDKEDDEDHSREGPLSVFPWAGTNSCFIRCSLQVINLMMMMLLLLMLLLLLLLIPSKSFFSQ